MWQSSWAQVHRQSCQLPRFLSSCSFDLHPCGQWNEALFLCLCTRGVRNRLCAIGDMTSFSAHTRAELSAEGRGVWHAGTNACYVEQLGHISKWLPRFLPRTPDMVVNIEWSGFRPQAVRPSHHPKSLDISRKHQLRMDQTPADKPRPRIAA